MKTIKKTFIACSTVLVSCPAAPVLAVDSDKEGARLFIYHGCVNCHGAEGRNPEMKKAPSLAGKRANKLFDNAMAILNGKQVSKESQVMYESFDQCDLPPNREEIRQITGWLSAL